MENENTNATASEQPEEQKRKRITAMMDVLKGGSGDCEKRVILGVQQYIDVIQQALNPMNSEDLPFVTAALKIYRDGIREDFDPAEQKLDKTIRDIVNKNGTTFAKVSRSVQVHAVSEEATKKVVEIIKERPEGKELEAALIAAGFVKRGNEWYEIEDEGESEETEEVD